MGKGKLNVALRNHQTLESAKKGAVKEKPVKPILQDPETSIADSSEDESLKSKKALPPKDKPLSRKEKRQMKKLVAQLEDAEESESSDSDESSEEELDLEKLAASESESDIQGESESGSDEESDDGSGSDNDHEEGEEEEEDVPLSEAEFDSDADVVPHSKLTINNIAALKDSLARIQLPWAKHSYVEHQSVLSATKAEEGIKDIYDDTERELIFYKQGLDAVKQGRKSLLKLKVPFSRPLDYFAEMVKSDEHMDKLKNKLMKEAADKKASEDAKKQRQLKKFGKKVQHETLQQRSKQKKEMLEKIKSLKKKRGANDMDNDAEFQIALEEATAEERPQKRQKPNGKRLAKDSKYGFGGKKRGARKNDAESSADVFNQRGKGKSYRPGKSKRARR